MEAEALPQSVEEEGLAEEDLYLIEKKLLKQVSILVLGEACEDWPLEDWLLNLAAVVMILLYMELASRRSILEL